MDDRIIRLIPQFLGSIFYKNKKFPISVNLNKKNIKDEVVYSSVVDPDHVDADPEPEPRIRIWKNESGSNFGKRFLWALFLTYL